MSHSRCPVELEPVEIEVKIRLVVGVDKRRPRANKELVAAKLAEIELALQIMRGINDPRHHFQQLTEISSGPVKND